MRFAGTLIITGAAGELDSVIAAALAAEGGVVRSMRSHPARPDRSESATARPGAAHRDHALTAMARC